jgi:hypothetical protein
VGIEKCALAPLASSSLAGWQKKIEQNRGQGNNKGEALPMHFAAVSDAYPEE